jgi:hypothetical protein
MTVPIDRQVECVRREIKLRERVYSRRVADGRMTQALSARELEAMRAVLETLLTIEESTRLI